MAKRRRLGAAQPEFLTHPGGTETKSALSAPPIAQVAGEASATAALRELSDRVAAARAEGLMLQKLPLEEVDATHLVRDRMVVEDADQAALIESLRARGQQTPIEVVDRGEGASPRYGLISGWRRVSALLALRGEAPQFGTVLAQIRSPETSGAAYVAMVEENEIRAGLSYYERARIVVKALEEGVFPDAKTALQTLYANVSRAKRSKIKSFMSLVETLDGRLRWPTHIGERLGLAMAQVLQADPAAAERLAGAVSAGDGPASPEEEQAALSKALRRPVPPAPPADPPNGAAGGGAVPLPDVAFDDRAGTITLSGAGVDAALAEALRRWLARR